jgi:hypothetical protein
MAASQTSSLETGAPAILQSCVPLRQKHTAYLCLFHAHVHWICSELIERGGKSLVVDYSMDSELEWTKGDFLKLRDYDEILELIDKGYNYMLREHDAGSVTDKFHTDKIAL